MFCVGAQNRFRFPAPEVVARFEAAGARCYRTDRDGAVTFRTDGQAIEVHAFRASGRSQDGPEELAPEWPATIVWGP